MKYLITVLLTLSITVASADSVFIPFHNNSTHTLKLSKNNVNRLDVPGDFIVSARCLSGQCQVSQDSADPNGGRLVELNSMSSDPFTLDVATMSGRHVSLYVTPKSMPGRVIILNPLDGGNEKINSISTGKSSPYVSSLLGLMKAMMQGKTPDNYGAQNVKGKSERFNNKVTATLKRRLLGQDLTGKIYIIKNNSSMPMTLSPSEFYEPGIRAVALSQQTLMKGDSAYLYTIGDAR